MDIFINNKYTKMYFSIIENAKNQFRKKSKDSYFESHHIFPKSLGGKNSKDNLILLTYKEHYICHWLLIKMCVCDIDIIKMKKAFFRMVTSNNKQERNFSSQQYEIAKKHAREAQYDRWKNEEYRNKQKEATSKDEYKKIKSQKSIDNWKNEEYRKSVTETLAITNANPEIKKKRSEIQKKTQNKPEVKEKNRQGVINYWKNSELVENHIRNMKIAYSTPEARLRNSNAQKRPEVIEKKRKSLLITNQKIEVKNRRKNAAKECQNRPGMKEKQSKIAKKLNAENQKICPHCMKICDFRNAKRWHFDKCKEKGEK
jgi:hypothetical protein